VCVTKVRNGWPSWALSFLSLRGHIFQEQVHDLLDHVVLGHWRGLVCFTMLISKSDFAVRDAFFLPGEGGLASGAHEVRRRYVSLPGVMGLTTHEFVVELVPEVTSIQTIWMTVFSVFYAHIRNRTGKISQPGHIYLRRRAKGRGK